MNSPHMTLNPPAPEVHMINHHLHRTVLTKAVHSQALLSVLPQMLDTA